MTDWSPEVQARLMECAKTLDSLEITPPIKMELSHESAEALRAALREIERLRRENLEWQDRALADQIARGEAEAKLAEALTLLRRVEIEGSEEITTAHAARRDAEARLAKVVEAAEPLLQEIAEVIDPNRTVWSLALKLRAALAASPEPALCAECGCLPYQHDARCSSQREPAPPEEKR